MLRLLGSPHTLCDGLTRRDFLHVGGLGALGLSLSDGLRLRAETGPRSLNSGSFGRAKSCILLFPYGSPPQHETFDPKPEAPAEIQGEMKSLATSLPGVRFGEGLPRIARIADRLCVVRSMTHPYPDHGVAYAVSGIPTYTPALETRPRDPAHWPFLGSVVDYVLSQRPGGAEPPVPRNIGLPWLLNSRTDMNVSAGPYAAFLGQAYDPIWAHFDGPGTRQAPHYTEGQAKTFHDPFAATTPEGRFHLGEAKSPADVPVERLHLRRSLLEQFDRARAEAETLDRTGALDRYRRLAYSLVTTSTLRRALDIGLEPMAVREQYGMTLFGQACLCARRLVEAECPFITVFWDGFGQFSGCAWDTHSNHYPRLRDYLLPGFDQAYAALLLDLESRGLLDSTLVLWMSEHGRTPKIDSKPKGAGRHHWSRVYSTVLAGGGSGRGRVVGSSDRLGGEVREVPVSPKDLLATTLHLLGIDPETTVADPQGRPVPVVGSGRVRPELVG